MTIAAYIPNPWSSMGWTCTHTQPPHTPAKDEKALSWCVYTERGIYIYIYSLPDNPASKAYKLLILDAAAAAATPILEAAAAAMTAAWSCILPIAEMRPGHSPIYTSRSSVEINVTPRASFWLDSLSLSLSRPAFSRNTHVRYLVNDDFIGATAATECIYVIVERFFPLYTRSSIAIYIRGRCSVCMYNYQSAKWYCGVCIYVLYTEWQSWLTFFEMRTVN